MKTLHIACRYKGDVTDALKKAVDKIDSDSIGLVATAQHLDELARAKQFLESRGKKAFIGGQILGCNLENALKIEKKVDAFLYIGSGRFHPLGIALKTKKRVFILDPISKELENITAEAEKWKKRQKGRIARAIGAKDFGIVISTRKGQFDMKIAIELKKRLGNRALLFAGEHIAPDNLLPFKVGAWINTGCPRLVDDYFERPMLNPEELENVNF